MSAQVTEAHRALARCIGRGNVGEYPQDVEHDAQLIAESEANATAELRLDRYRAVKGRHEAEHERDQLRAEVERLREWQREVIQNANAHHAERKEAIARAEKAEAELAGIRALANRRNKRDHSQDTTHQLVAALDQALDIAQAELAAERARLRVLREACESICEEWGRNHDANPIGAGQKMETLASKALEKLEDAT